MLTETEINSRLKRSAIINGIILGVIVLMLSIFSYYFITRMTGKPVFILGGPYIFNVLVPIFVVVLFCISMRKKVGGYWIFKQAVRSVFIMFLISYGILTVGRDWIFAKAIEPDMLHRTEVVMLKVKAESLMRGGVKPVDIKSEIDQLKKDFDQESRTGPFLIIQNYIINIILLFVLSLVFAAIFKKEPPVLLTAN